MTVTEGALVLSKGIDAPARTLGHVVISGKQSPATIDVDAVTDGMYISDVDDKTRAILSGFDIEDQLSIITFGGDAQKETARLADELIANARGKDAGEIGEIIGEFISELRGYGIEKELKPGQKTLFDRIGEFFSGNGLMRFLQKYETIAAKITATTDRVISQRNRLHQDLLWLEKQYDATENYYLDLERYIIASRIVLIEMDRRIEEQRRVAEESRSLLDAQRTRELEERRVAMDRTLGDLCALRQEAHDTLGQIRVTINGDAGMMQKLERIVSFTIPAWKRQIALAITIMNQQGAATLSRQISDATNKILRAKADALKGSAVSVAQEMERSVFDADTLVYCTDALMTTMQEVAKAHEDGAKRRREDAKLYNEKQQSMRSILLRRREQAARAA